MSDSLTIASVSFSSEQRMLDVDVSNLYISGWCRMEIRWGSRSCIFCWKAHLEGEKKTRTKFKAIDCSSGKFVSYSFRHMNNESEMPILAISRSSEQDSLSVFPAVFSDRFRHRRHRIWSNRTRIERERLVIVQTRLHHRDNTSDLNPIRLE